MVSTEPAGLRIVFFGTPDFAVPTLERLLQSPHRVVAIVTQPDRPRGRGQRPADSPVKRVARDHNVRLLQPASIRDETLLASLRESAPDLGVVAAYGRMLPDVLLAMPPLGLLNVHASLLPQYRGAAPVHRAVIAGESQTGVTVMRVVRELDAGPILATARRSIGPDDTSLEVEHDLARIGAALLIDVIAEIQAGRQSEIEQDGRLATYAPRLTKAEGLIDWAQPAGGIHNKVRGLHPWPHAYTYLDGARVIILNTRRGAPGPAGGVPGTILQAAGDQLRVLAGDGQTLEILRIQPEGRRPLSPREFLNGHHIAAGSIAGGHGRS